VDEFTEAPQPGVERPSSLRQCGGRPTYGVTWKDRLLESVPPDVTTWDVPEVAPGRNGSGDFSGRDDLEKGSIRFGAHQPSSLVAGSHLPLWRGRGGNVQTWKSLCLSGKISGGGGPNRWMGLPPPWPILRNDLCPPPSSGRMRAEMDRSPCPLPEKSYHQQGTRGPIKSCNTL
jgi:hypothetical protein